MEINQKKIIVKRPRYFLYFFSGISLPFFIYIARLSQFPLERGCDYSYGIYVILIFLTLLAEEVFLKKKLRDNVNVVNLIFLNIFLFFFYWSWFVDLLVWPNHCSDNQFLQKEAYGDIYGFVKSSKAFFIENGKLATSTKDLGEYISVFGCKTNDWRICRYSDSGENYADKEITRWYTPSGNYEIEMKSGNDQNIFVATPTGKIKKKGFGVSGCFNSKNGKTKILGMDTKGTNVEIANCSD